MKFFSFPRAGVGTHSRKSLKVGWVERERNPPKSPKWWVSLSLYPPYEKPKTCNLQMPIFSKIIFILLFSCLSQIAVADVISTIVGNGTQGYSGDDKVVTLTQINKPSDVAVSGGNVYIADTNNHRIRKIDASGNISTVAGDGTSGFSGDGGAAMAAQLNSPAGIAFDSAGNLYIVDTDNHRIRKVDTKGNIFTLVGNGNQGFSGDGSLAINAKLNEPMAVCFDSSGNLYIADSGNNVIRKLEKASGKISTVAGNNNAGFSGDGNAAFQARLNYPTGVAVDSVGNLYIADSANHRLRKVVNLNDTNPYNDIIYTIAGDGTQGFNGDGNIPTQLNQPYDVIVDSSGDLYFTDMSNHRLRKIKTDNIIITIAGDGNVGYSGDGGNAKAAKLNSPKGIALDSAGNIYFADFANYRIRKISVNHKHN